MAEILIIGAGGVGNVVAHKCVQHPDVFSTVTLASRRIEKCEAIRDRKSIPIQTEQVNADKVGELEQLIQRVVPDIVINSALPGTNLPIMEACLSQGVHYVDTSAPEPDTTTYELFAYSHQLKFHSAFKEKNLTAVLSCGFAPGVTNIFCAHALKEHFDEIHYVDIVDCNGGDHGHPFATNFDPFTNIAEIIQPCMHFQEGKWIESEALKTFRSFPFPNIGTRKMVQMYHEELESLVAFLPDLKRIRFWMTFTDSYLQHLDAFRNIGLTGLAPIQHKGMEIVPLEFLKTLLPDPSELAPGYTGKTCIGCQIEGLSGGQWKRFFIYNICDHQASFRELGSQAISYTTGVPAMISAMLIAQGSWQKPGVHCCEQLNPSPFLEQLNRCGLPWVETEVEMTLNEDLKS
ncbi:MAG TPA: saccharopine dehydrogenase family protein [Verrucomicrobiales bacterium]|nr:saccharopine dehydrogenase family protein [Verrucomicrobiales bacterium]HIL72158.1 saccharopine dehydrogenase family protein [Verrucomicrobiota bacterium]